MPTYEFDCVKCGKVEKFYQMSKSPESIKCKCGRAMKRLIGSGSGVIFKGEGWTKKFHNKKGGEKNG